MKKLCVLLVALISSAAHADIFASARNEAGGEIVLLDSQGNCKSGSLQMFARTRGGSISTGCWFFDKPYVYVTYSDGDLRVYDGGGFTVADKYRTSNKRGDL